MGVVVILKAARTMRRFGTVSMVETTVRLWTMLLAVGPFGAANVIDVIDSSAIGSRATAFVANVSRTDVAGPTVQQAVTYPIRLQPSGTSTCTRCVDFHLADGFSSNRMSPFKSRQIGPQYLNCKVDEQGDALAVNQTYLINPMKASIYKGLHSPNVTLSDVSASCNSGNCTWPTYSSLTICALKFLFNT